MQKLMNKMLNLCPVELEMQLNDFVESKFNIIPTEICKSE